jgi:hypothetical protein
MRKAIPACLRKHKPIPHLWVTLDADPDYERCTLGDTWRGPTGMWGAPIEKIDAAPVLLFGDETPPIVPRSARMTEAEKDAEALARLKAAHDESKART